MSRGGRLEAEQLAGAPAGGVAEPLPQRRVGEQHARAPRAAPSRRPADEQPGLAVDDRVGEAADGGRDHRPAVRHRLGARRRRSPRGATGTRPPRPARVGADLRRRDEADRARHRARSGPSPTMTSGSPPAAATSSRTPFSSREPPDVEHVRRLVGRPDLGRGSRRRSGRPATSRAPSSPRRRRPAPRTRAITSRARRSTRPKSQRARRASSTSVPQSWTTNGLPVASAASADGSQCACTRSASAAARRAARAKAKAKAAAQRRHGRRAQVAGDPVSVRDPVVPERRRRHDLDVDPRRRTASTASRDEEPGDVFRRRADTTSSGRRPSRLAAAGEHDRAPRRRAARTRRSSRTTSSGRRRSRRSSPTSAAVSPHASGRTRAATGRRRPARPGRSRRAAPSRRKRYQTNAANTSSRRCPVSTTDAT